MKSFLKNKQFGRDIRKAAVLTAAIASLGFASASWAASITIKHLSTEGKPGNITGYSGNVNAGLFNFNVVTPPAASTAEWNSTLQAFCIDVNRTLVTNSNVIYDIVPATGTGGLSSLQLAQVSWLFDNHESDLGSDAGNAAFQLTLWEIFFETGSTLNLHNGSFEAESGFSGARATANAWLSGVPTSDDGYTSDKWEFYVLNPTNPEKNQRLITWREKDDPSVPPQEISEPGTLLLLSIGLGVAFFSTRRRSEMQLASLA